MYRFQSGLQPQYHITVSVPDVDRPLALCNRSQWDKNHLPTGSTSIVVRNPLGICLAIKFALASGDETILSANDFNQ